MLARAPDRTGSEGGGGGGSLLVERTCCAALWFEFWVRAVVAHNCQQASGRAVNSSSRNWASLLSLETELSEVDVERTC